MQELVREGVGWGGGRHSAGVSERGGGETAAHLPQHAGLKLSPHLGSDRDDLCTVMRHRTHL